MKQSYDDAERLLFLKKVLAILYVRPTGDGPIGGGLFPAFFLGVLNLERYGLTIAPINRCST